jgi:AcrR family transcriptional regulator
MPDRIVAAAYACFDRFGVVKTTIEDIASTAKVSRPTIYKYFANKEEIVDRISILESTKVTAEVRRRVVRQKTIAETLTEVLLLVVRVASENPYVRRLLETTSTSSHAAAPDSPIHKAYQGLWGGFLSRAMDAGEFASDLALSDVTSWLTSAEGLLLVKVGDVDISDADLRRFIRRFIVEPLLPRREAPASAGGRRKSISGGGKAAQKRTPSST